MRRQRLFVPEAAQLLIHASAAQRLIAVENLVGVHHHALALAHYVEGQPNAPRVVIKPAAADFDLDSVIALLHGVGEGAAVAGQVVVIVVIPAAHGVDGHAVAKGA